MSVAVLTFSNCQLHLSSSSSRSGQYNLGNSGGLSRVSFNVRLPPLESSPGQWLPNFPYAFNFVLLNFLPKVLKLFRIHHSIPKAGGVPKSKVGFKSPVLHAKSLALIEAAPPYQKSCTNPKISYKSPVLHAKSPWRSNAEVNAKSPRLHTKSPWCSIFRSRCRSQYPMPKVTGTTMPRVHNSRTKVRGAPNFRVGCKGAEILAKSSEHLIFKGPLPFPKVMAPPPFPTFPVSRCLPPQKPPPGRVLR